MATFEVTRDLRSDAQDPKRAKERYAKWSRGTRPSAGCKVSPWEPDVIIGGSESQRAKVRPQRAYENHRLPNQNIVKAKMMYDVPPSHSRAKIHALEELKDNSLSRSLIEMLPAPGDRRQPTVSEIFPAGFNRSESTNKSASQDGIPLSLEVFVKTNPRETEKFVEKEYEILDINGDALRGRKARKNLRRLHQEPSMEPEVVEDDGFELV